MILSDLPTDILCKILESGSPTLPPIYWTEMMCVNKALRNTYLQVTKECGVNNYIGTPKNTFKAWVKTVQQWVTENEIIYAAYDVDNLCKPFLVGTSTVKQFTVFLKMTDSISNDVMLANVDMFLTSIRYNKVYIDNFVGKSRFITISNLAVFSDISECSDADQICMLIEQILTFAVLRYVIQLNGPMLRKYLDMFADYHKYLDFVYRFTCAIRSQFNDAKYSLYDQVQSSDHNHRCKMLQLFIDNIPSRVEVITKMVMAPHYAATAFMLDTNRIIAGTHNIQDRYLIYCNPDVLPPKSMIHSKLDAHSIAAYRDRVTICLREQTSKTYEEVYESILALYEPTGAIFVQLNKELQMLKNWEEPGIW